MMMIIIIILMVEKKFAIHFSIKRYVDELLYWSGKRMKFDDFLQGELVPKRLPSSWVTNTKFIFQSDDGSLAILDTANDSVTTLVTNHTLVSFMQSFTFILFTI
jgi:inactive dipeptidyl peptidase 10